MITLTINGQIVQAQPGDTVLEAARQAGIFIPTLCDHPELEPYGGCRLCLIEVKGARLPMASCTLPASAGMIVETDTEPVRAARKFVLSMLFSERNHFCPFCQVSGGDCELQNNAYGLGMTHWPIQPGWEKFPVDTTHPYFVLDNNRCILCRRCVRACGDLVGNHTLGIEKRGTHTLLVADYGAPWGESTCVACGSCVQVCPTGALMHRPSVYQGQSQDVTHTPSICIGCSLGCGVDLWTRDNRLVRIDGDWKSPVSGGVLCHRGRLETLKETRTRLTQPMLRKQGQLVETTWEEALSVAAQKLANCRVAAIASTRLPIEALAVFKQIFEQHLAGGLATTTEEGFPTGAISHLAETIGQPFEATLADLDSADAVVCIGANLLESHPVAGFMVKRSLNRGLKLVVVDPEPNPLAGFADVILNDTSDETILSALAEALRQGSGRPEVLTAAQIMSQAKNLVFVYGKGLTRNLATESLRRLLALTEQLPGSKLLGLKGEANSLAAAQLGLEKRFDTAQCQAAFAALGDMHVSERLAQQLSAAPFLVVQASYASTITERADVVLPTTTWVETQGHYLNLEGRLQTSQAAIQPPAGVYSHLESLNALAQRLGLAPVSNWQEMLTRRNPSVALVLN